MANKLTETFLKEAFPDIQYSLIIMVAELIRPPTTDKSVPNDQEIQQALFLIELLRRSIVNKTVYRSS